MKNLYWFVLGALASTHLAAIGQEAASRKAHDADAPVPALAYHSAFEGFSLTEREPAVTPDQAWRPAHAQLTQAQGHAAHHGGHTQEAEAPAQPAPKAPAKPQPKPEHQHQHQHQHEGK
ncbi:hypothetical protein [Pseudoduganella sp. GCM10020061]|uniref:hypothetical protein n=1 Tax=Pseudoduganella sp. GCM10020061 TaxID=3317345 RepID=UPI003642E0F6